MNSIDIENIASERLLRVAELKEASFASGKTFEEILDEVSLGIARRYISGQVDFGHGDAVMNGLHDAILLSTEGRVSSEIAWSVFLAFDAGEFRNPKDGKDIDPEQKYTRPQILKILAEYEKKNGA